MFTNRGVAFETIITFSVGTREYGEREGDVGALTMVTVTYGVREEMMSRVTRAGETRPVPTREGSIGGKRAERGGRRAIEKKEMAEEG